MNHEITVLEFADGSILVRESDGTVVYSPQGDRIEGAGRRESRQSMTTVGGVADSLKRQRFPMVDPYESGLLDVGDGNRIYWECSGNPRGRPVVVVHGGPGGGGRRGSRKLFDPEVFRVVQFDQRGCGESVPHASDPDVDMGCNTTEHLLGDMEMLREHLGIERWVLYGGSWGATLSVAYAQRHPDRVLGIVLVGVTMTRPREIDWLYRGVRIFLPAEWERFRDGVPPTDRDGNLVEAYRKLLENPDSAVREAAAREWCAWEDAVIAHENLGAPGQFSAMQGAERMAFVRICTHYYARHGWLPDNALLDNAPLLARIPGVLVHGRLDLSAPVHTAWELSRAWPDAELKIIEDSGHTGSPTMQQALFAAVDRFATQSGMFH